MKRPSHAAVLLRWWAGLHSSKCASQGSAVQRCRSPSTCPLLHTGRHIAGGVMSRPTAQHATHLRRSHSAIGPMTGRYRPAIAEIG